LLSGAVPVWERTHTEAENLLTKAGVPPDQLRQSLRMLV
jgi:hypothetical protein